MAIQPENEFIQLLGARIREQREVLKLSRASLADSLGVAVSTLQAWENGEREPGASFIAKLSELLSVTAHWLITGDSAELSHKPESQHSTDVLGNVVDISEFVFVPRYNVSAAAGHGAWNDDEAPMFSVSFRRYWITNYLRANPRDLSVISVRGDSMEGVLNDKDIILINHADHAPGEGIYVLRIDGQLLVKRVQILPGLNLYISSTNQAYKPFTVSLTDTPEDFAIIGKVVWYGRML
ncbi:helix-turn-helix transcriptional regulator [Klebsiella pneumoniae]|nr:helix-turn-helix transcriptional regulator [Klebsiella pneumoniae]